MNRTIVESDHDLFRTSVREFVEREMTPNVPRWEEEGIVDKELFRKAGRAGMLGMGSGLCITLHNDVVLVDAQVMALNAGELSAEEAAKAKWWVTELENKVISRCLQMFGGWGYMEEHPIARAFWDARVQTIYGERPRS